MSSERFRITEIHIAPHGDHHQVIMLADMGDGKQMEYAFHFAQHLTAGVDVEEVGFKIMNKAGKPVVHGKEFDATLTLYGCVRTMEDGMLTSMRVVDKA